MANEQDEKRKALFCLLEECIASAIKGRWIAERHTRDLVELAGSGILGFSDDAFMRVARRYEKLLETLGKPLSEYERQRLYNGLLGCYKEKPDGSWERVERK